MGGDSTTWFSSEQFYELACAGFDLHAARFTALRALAE